MEIALRVRDLDSGRGQMLVNQVVQVAPEPARLMTHLAAPGDELEIHRAAGANLPDCAQDAGYFDAIPDRDRALRQNDQTADEVTGDVLQTKSHTDANRTGKNREGSEMDASVLENKENADHQHDVADD